MVGEWSHHWFLKRSREQEDLAILDDDVLALPIRDKFRESQLVANILEFLAEEHAMKTSSVKEVAYKTSDKSRRKFKARLGGSSEARQIENKRTRIESRDILKDLAIVTEIATALRYKKRENMLRYKKRENMMLEDDDDDSASYLEYMTTSGIRGCSRD